MKSVKINNQVAENKLTAQELEDVAVEKMLKRAKVKSKAIRMTRKFLG